MRASGIAGSKAAFSEYYSDDPCIIGKKMRSRWVFGLLVLAVGAASVFCACEPDCCPLPPSSSQSSEGGSSPLEGPNCPCATATESDQRASIDLDPCLLVLDHGLPTILQLDACSRGLADGSASWEDVSPKLFVVNHQLVI